VSKDVSIRGYFWTPKRDPRPKSVWEALIYPISKAQVVMTITQALTIYAITIRLLWPLSGEINMFAITQ
jgi:hypothetical protein